MKTAESTELEVIGTDDDCNATLTDEEISSQDLKASSLVQLRTRNKIAYGLGSMPYNLTVTVIDFYIAVFLLQVQPAYSSIVIFSARIFDAIANPVVGILITRTDTKLGKLKPWMAVSAPLATATFIFLWTVPNFESEVGAFFWYFCFNCGLQVLITCYDLPYGALTMFLSEEQHDRDSATAYRIAFEQVGNVLGTIIMGQSILAFTYDDKNKVCISGNETMTVPNVTDAIAEELVGYQVGAAVLGLVLMISASTLIFGTTELKIKHKSDNTMTLKQALPKTLSFKPYLILASTFLFFMIAIQSIQGNFALYCKHTLLIEKYQYIIMMILALTVAFLPVWWLIIRKIDRKNALLMAAATPFPLLLLYGFIPPGHVWVMYASCLLAGNAIAALQLVPWSMLPDVIDDFLVKYEHSYDAIFYSFFVMFIKISAGAVMGLSTLILRSVGFRSGYCEQPKAVVFTLRILVTVFPGSCFIIAFFIILAYPITEKARQLNKTILKTRREQYTHMLQNPDKTCRS